MAYMSDAQQHDDDLEPLTGCVREVTLIACTVTVRPLVVLNNDSGVLAGENDVGDVLGESFLACDVDFLCHSVSPERKASAGRKLAVDVLHEQPLKGVAELVCPVRVQQPRKHVGQLLLVEIG